MVLMENQELDIKKLNVYQKVLLISNEIEVVRKNLNIEYGKTKYKAVGEADVLKAVKPLEVKYGIYSFPFSREVIESGEIENSNRKSLFLRVKTIYRFVNVDKPTEYIDQIAYGDGVDSQDKAPGKAMTYSDKYSLLKAYKIETGDDPDQEPSQPLDKTKTKKADGKPISNKEKVWNAIRGTNFEAKDVAVLIKALFGKELQANDLTNEQMGRLLTEIANQTL